MDELRPNIPEEYTFRICERFLDTGEKEDDEKPTGATRISEWLKSEGFKCSREKVYAEVAKGIKRGFMKLCPPQEMRLAQRLADKFGIDLAGIRVLNVSGPTTAVHLATEGAEKILTLIKQVAKKGKRVHIGFGAGRTTQRVARSLAMLLRSEPDVPPLTIHALSSGFSVKRPETAPVAYFSFFNDVRPAVECIGLFAPAVVKSKEYQPMIKLPGVRESFAKENKGQLDIVITSLARRKDKHGLLNVFMEMAPKRGIKALERAGWIGDVQWRPYSADGPIEADAGIKAVTLFELPELVEMAQTPGKHVILLSGPCNTCGQSKAEALRPLLEVPSLRVCNHLITDVLTARETLE